MCPKAMQLLFEDGTVHLFGTEAEAVNERSHFYLVAKNIRLGRQDRQPEAAAALRPHLSALAAAVAALLRGPFAKPDRMSAAAGAAAGTLTAAGRLFPAESLPVLLGEAGIADVTAAAAEAGANNPPHKVREVIRVLQHRIEVCVCIRWRPAGRLVLGV